MLVDSGVFLYFELCSSCCTGLFFRLFTQEAAGETAGPCGLKAELQRLRGILLMGSPAMQLWCGRVASRLNAGIRMAGGGDALSSTTLLELDALLQQHLCDGSMLSLEQLAERCVARCYNTSI